MFGSHLFILANIHNTDSFALPLKYAIIPPIIYFLYLIVKFLIFKLSQTCMDSNTRQAKLQYHHDESRHETYL